MVKESGGKGGGEQCDDRARHTGPCGHSHDRFDAIARRLVSENGIHPAQDREWVFALNVGEGQRSCECGRREQQRR